jgi:hypothetical protein
MSALSAFNSQLIKFFDDLSETFPEERDIRIAKEALEGARKINPRLILDLFYEHVAKDLRDAIMTENAAKIVEVARIKIQTQFNEILPALAIFDKHWNSLSDGNKQSIWRYLKVLILLADKAMA